MSAEFVVIGLAYRFIDFVILLLVALIFPLPVLFGVSHLVRLK
jgi:hypothetical protein